ncbi:MAG: BrnT family toxin [Pseudomonadota bacterium]|nr:BrnT family toxin [Pseudomonadota bacterium]
MADIEFDPEKSRRNAIEREIDFYQAARIFDGPVIEWQDIRKDYGETRFIAVGREGGDILTVVYTWRDDRRRIISARKASKRERDVYRSYYN